MSNSRPREAEGAVAEQADDLAVGVGDLGADRLARAGAETAVGAGVHPAAGLVGIDDAAGVGDEVAAVADHDRVAVEHLGELVVDPQRVQRRAVVGELVGLAGALLGLGLAQRLRPSGRSRSRRRRRARGHPGLAHRRQRRRDPADQLQLGPAVRGQLVRSLVEPDQLRLLAERAAEAEPEVERHADHERDVGPLQPLAAGAAEAELVVGRQTAAAHAVEEDGDPERLGERAQLVLAPRPVEAGAGHDHRALGGGEQLRRLLGALGRRRRARARTAAPRPRPP